MPGAVCCHICAPTISAGPLSVFDAADNVTQNHKSWPHRGDGRVTADKRESIERWHPDRK
jgi:hypothetical protein